MSLPTWIRINTRNQVESSSSPVFWPCIDRIRHEGGRKMKTALQFDWKLNVSFASPAHFRPTKSGNRAWHPIRHFYTRNSVDCVSARVNKLAWRMMIDSNPFWQLICTQIVIRGRFSSIVSTFFTEKARRICGFFSLTKNPSNNVCSMDPSYCTTRAKCLSYRNDDFTTRFTRNLIYGENRDQALFSLDKVLV